ncbi:MAG TPA: isocitrate lyase/phosphoenolpyruvate mutase family protein [Solirubrobacteraceae bacterium]|nr:isocitrate lyase/phosphoenolpyruvate mutase family protein [Solirubrobacteraceae bacterium]
MGCRHGHPWDAGTAIALRQLGFQALATTSAGLSFSRGRPDTPDALPVDAVLDHVAEIVAGSFAGLDGAATFAELNTMFAA